MRILILILFLITNLFASITPSGYYGYSYTPTPSSLSQGEIGYAARFDLTGERNIWHSAAIRPVSFLELGAGISRDPVPAAKIILPFFDSLSQKAALGFSGKKWYFTGMLQNISESNNAYNLTIAGVYDADLHFPVGSIAGEADFGYASFSVENFVYQSRYGAAANFTFRPFVALDLPSYLEANASAAWRSPEYKEKISAFAGLQVKATVIETEKEPAVYIDINPAFDHSVTFARNHYPSRFALDMDAVLVAAFDFYIATGISPSISTENQDRLVRRDLFDRCYLLWDPNNNSMWAAAGMLNSGIFGFQWQAGKKLYNSNPMALTLGYTIGEQEGITAIGQVPLHSNLSGALSKSLFFAEGGLFLGGQPAVQLNFRQGKEKKHLQLGSGYDFNKKSIFGELSLQYDFSLSKKLNGIEFRAAPNLRHRESTPFYVFDYDVPIYQEGNNSRRLHNFPWKR